MYTFNKNNFSKLNILNFLIASLSFTLIMGNLATNLNIILIIIFGLIIYKHEVFFGEKKIIINLVYFFFIYLIIVTVVNNFNSLNLENTLYEEHLLKSFFFLRFLLLFLVINKLIEKNELNFKIIIYFFSFFALIVAIDVVYQSTFGINVFGTPITINKPSSFFGDENIAGGYLQKFILFTIILISSKINKKNSNNFILALFIISIIPIILTSNRMPVVLFMMSTFIFFLLKKKFKEIVVSIIIFFFISLATLKSPIENKYSSYYSGFIDSSIELVKKSPKLFFYGAKKGEKIRVGDSGYLITFYSGVQTWKEKKVFGAGLKSFRINCKFTLNQVCNTHPHNYIIEILVDTGIIGFLTIYSIFLFGTFNFLKISLPFYDLKKNLLSNYFSMIMFIIILLEFFPIRSSGSFFTTNNATIVFFLLPFFLNPKKILLNNKF